MELLTFSLMKYWIWPDIIYSQPLIKYWLNGTRFVPSKYNFACLLSDKQEIVIPFTINCHKTTSIEACQQEFLTIRLLALIFREINGLVFCKVLWKWNCGLRLISLDTVAFTLCKKTRFIHQKRKFVVIKHFKMEFCSLKRYCKSLEVNLKTWLLYTPHHKVVSLFF